MMTRPPPFLCMFQIFLFLFFIPVISADLAISVPSDIVTGSSATFTWNRSIFDPQVKVVLVQGTRTTTGRSFNTGFRNQAGVFAFGISNPFALSGTLVVPFTSAGLFELVALDSRGQTIAQTDPFLVRLVPPTQSERTASSLLPTPTPTRASSTLVVSTTVAVADTVSTTSEIIAAPQTTSADVTETATWPFIGISVIPSSQPTGLGALQSQENTAGASSSRKLSLRSMGIIIGVAVGVALFVILTLLIRFWYPKYLAKKKGKSVRIVDPEGGETDLGQSSPTPPSKMTFWYQRWGPKRKPSGTESSENLVEETPFSVTEKVMTWYPLRFSFKKKHIPILDPAVEDEKRSTPESTTVNATNGPTNSSFASWMPLRPRWTMRRTAQIPPSIPESVSEYKTETMTEVPLSPNVNDARTESESIYSAAPSTSWYPRWSVRAPSLNTVSEGRSPTITKKMKSYLDFGPSPKLALPRLSTFRNPFDNGGHRAPAPEFDVTSPPLPVLTPTTSRTPVTANNGGAATPGGTQFVFVTPTARQIQLEEEMGKIQDELLKIQSSVPDREKLPEEKERAVNALRERMDQLTKLKGSTWAVGNTNGNEPKEVPQAV